MRCRDQNHALACSGYKQAWTRLHPLWFARPVRWLVFLTLLVAAMPGWTEEDYTAKPQHALAMHDAPALPKNFNQLPYVNADAPKGGALHVAELGSFDTLNPFNLKGKAPPQLDWTFDRLMARSWDEPFTLYGLVAQSVELPANHHWLAFNLNPAAHFQDGTLITAADVLATFNTLKTQGRPNMRAMYKLVAEVRATSATRVLFIFKPVADPELPMILGLMPVLSAKNLAAIDFNKTTLAALISSGPYKIAVADAGRRLILQRDPNYWGQNLAFNRGQYNFDSVEVSFYRDENMAHTAFKAKALDWWRELNPIRWLNGYHVQTANTDQLIRKELVDQKPAALRAIVFNTREPLFQELHVRQALRLAFDFDSFNQQVFGGTQAQANSIFAKSALSANSWQPEKDPRAAIKQAQALLETAGWQWNEKDKSWQIPHGKAEFEFLFNSVADEKLGLYLRANLAKLGIPLKIKRVDSAEYSGRLTRFEFQLTPVIWASSLSPGSEQLVYWGSQAAELPGSRNYAGIKSPKIDQLASDLNNAKNADDLIQRARKLDMAVMAGAYFIPLDYSPADRIAYWQDKISWPEKVPAYGTVLESWWAK